MPSPNVRPFAWCAAMLVVLCWTPFVAAQSLSSFTMSPTSLDADGQQTSTWTLTLTEAGAVDQARFLVNYPPHAENGEGYKGYFQITASSCQEISPNNYGNPDVSLDPGVCQRTVLPGGDVQFTMGVRAEPGFGDSSNNQVSAIWYASGVAQTGWRRATTSGAGFDTVAVEEPVAQPGTLKAFSFDQESITANGTDLQTLRLTLHGAALIDDVRLILNRPGQSENGEGYSGYFQWTPSGCVELGGGLGNADVALSVSACQANVHMDGAVEFVFPFAAESSFGAADNNQVSAIWYEDGSPKTGWQRVTTQGAGFDVEADDGFVVPSTFGSFGFDQAMVQANGLEVQHLRLVLDNAANVDDVRLILNRPGQSENGKGYSGYFQWTPSTCAELGGGLGNADVGLQGTLCEANARFDGSIEYVFPFVVEPAFGSVDNNQVSAIWYEAGTPRTGWRRVTTQGAGFDVTGGISTPSFEGFSFDSGSIQSNGADLQTLRLTLVDGQTVDDVRLIINRPPQSENGRSYSGYFQWTPSGCVELGGGLGNADVALSVSTCQANVHMDGAVEFVFPFAAESSFGAANNNQISAIWYVQGEAQTGWRRVTTSGAGFDVTEPGALVRNACGGFGALAQSPGDPCGPGNLERLICTDPNTLSCDQGPTFSKLTTGEDQVCAILEDGGQVQCWGRNDFGETSPPTGVFTDLSGGDFFTCGVRSDGTLACWGRDNQGQSSPPTGTFSQVAAGQDHACALRVNGTVACWGNGGNGETTAPSGTFLSVTTGDGHSCGIRTNNTVQCWGINNLGEGSPPSDTFQAIDAGTNFTCGIRSDNTVVCWGSNALGQLGTPSGQFTDLSADSFYACATRTDGENICWGTADDGQDTPPAGPWASVSSAQLISCGLRTDGAAMCWGKPGEEPLDVPRSGLCGGAQDPPQAPGTSCGSCGLDLFYCSSETSTTCSGDTAGNACGGCATLEDEPGDACGRCGQDNYVCDGLEVTTCDGDTPTNACGGCGTLSPAPGASCGGGNLRVCDGTEATSCSADLNACGGDNTLTQNPGTACTDQGSGGFLYCHSDRGLACSAGFAPWGGDLQNLPDATLTTAAAGELFSADVNQDGVGDIITGTRIYLGPISEGETPRLSLNTLIAFGRVEPVGDLNGDGATDLLIGNRDIIYGPATTSAQVQGNDAQVQGFTARAAGHGDINGDGKDDLVMRDSNGWHVFHGPINGNLTAADADAYWSNNTSDAVLADVDHDGFTDLVLERCVQSAPQSGGTTVTLATALLGPATGLTNLTSGLQLTAFEPTGNLSEQGCSTLAAAGDTDGDGFQDLTLAQTDHRTAGDLRGRIVVIEGQWDSDLSLGQPEDAVPAGTRSLSSTVQGDNVRDLVWAGGDIDADGEDDLIYLGFQFLYGDPAFAVALNPSSATGIDVNGDGFSDMILATGVDLRVFFGAPSSN